MGVEHTFTLTPVGVFFGEPGKEVPDPFFGGAGPRRTGCTQCASCMTGCRVGAKNTLDKNYLYFAEKLGAELYPLTTVVHLRPRRGSASAATAVRTGRPLRRRPQRQTLTAQPP